MNPELLRRLPKMDLLLARPALAEHPLPYPVKRQAARQVLDDCRRALREGALASVPGPEELEGAVLRLAERLSRPALGRVINATGIVLHTNLGRAPLSRRAAEAVGQAARGDSNLEYDLPNRCRGRRGEAAEGLLCSLTGAEGALAVNNNAAAVFLLLSALAAGDLAGVARRMYNVFEDALPPRRAAEIQRLKTELIQQGALGACMSGTGSALFGLFSDGEAAARARDALALLCPTCFLARPVEKLV